jgi:DNA replication licensing factor MCM6
MDPGLKASLRQKVEQLFLEFLTKFRQRNADGGYESEYFYIEQARHMVQTQKNTLYINFRDFDEIDQSTISFNPQDLQKAIQNKYMTVRDALNAAVPRLLERIPDKALVEEVKKLREENGGTRYVAAFFGLPTFSGIRDLRTNQMGKLVTISGTVTRSTEVKPELLVGTFKCHLCDSRQTNVEQQFKVTFPTVCANKGCGNRDEKSWTLLGEDPTTRWGDWQRIRLQENENEVPPGSMPRSLDLIVRDEATEQCKPGDKVLVTGSLIVVPDVPSMMKQAELKTSVRRSLSTRSDPSYGQGVRGLSSTGQRDLTYKLCFFGCFVDESSDWGSRTRSVGENVRSDDKVELTQQDRDKFNKILEHVGPGGKSDCFDQLARSIAPAVHGHLDVKKGILLMLIGGLPKTTDEGIKLRGDLNVCILGDPATAKSALLKWVSKFLPRAVFTSGKTSSAAGLTAAVVREQDLDNEKVIEPGALMLADNGVCCIDEFETMDPKDQVAIHEAMEQQTITLAKAGIKATLNAKTSILAACLPKDTYYNPQRPIHKNVDMSPPIMSRFDLMFVVQDIHDTTTHDLVAKHILALHRAKEEDTQGPLGLSTLELQRFIRVARSYRPRVTPEAHERLVKCYKKLREDRAYVRGACGVTVRQLESLVRLSEGVARVHLMDKITVEHVQEAFNLQFDALRRAEHENIDLGEDEPALPAAAAAVGEEGEEVAAPAAQEVKRKKAKITFADYERISYMLVQHLADKDGVEVTEEELTNWYLEQIEEEIQTEAQLEEKQQVVQLIIARLVNTDRAIIVYRQSPDESKPEQRVLQKHPNFVVGGAIAGSRHH